MNELLTSYSLVAAISAIVVYALAFLLVVSIVVGGVAIVNGRDEAAAHRRADADLRVAAGSAFAREAAAEGMVLLENRGELPWDASALRTVAVPFADEQEV